MRAPSWLSAPFVVGSLLTIAAVSYIGYYLYENLERYEYTVEAGVSDEARKNPLLASTRLLEEYGYETSLIQNLSGFRNLDSKDGEVIWLNDAEALPEGSLLDELAQWTDDGGHLILGLTEPLSDRMDDLLIDFGIEAYNDRDSIRALQPWEELYQINFDEDDSYDEFTHYHRPNPHDPYGNPSRRDPTMVFRYAYDGTLRTLPVQGPDGGAITVHYNNKAEMFTDLELLHGLRVPVPDGPFVLAQFQYGGGIVTVLGDNKMFSHGSLADHDNGFYLLSLLSVHPSNKVHYLLDVRESPNLLSWLWDKFPTMIVMFIAALLSWVLFSAARLGPVRQEVPAGRTNLLSHLRARGHFWRRRGELPALSEPVQQAAVRAIKRKHPTGIDATADQIPESILKEVATELGCSTSQLRHALTHKNLAARDLPNAGKILQRLIHQPSIRSKNATRSRS